MVRRGKIYQSEGGRSTDGGENGEVRPFFPFILKKHGEAHKEDPFQKISTFSGRNCVRNSSSGQGARTIA